MSQENTYRPAVLPSEAVMMPAVESVDETPEAPIQATQQEAGVEDAAKMPARTRRTGAALERIRGRMRHIDSNAYDWKNAAEMPLDGASIRQSSSQSMRPERPESRLMAQGAALSTLMRSATLQHSPPPVLTPSMRGMMQTSSNQFVGQPQMRGALRQVIRKAQQQVTGGQT